ncbi:AbrB/MazE/SpoVT family DNA-binding domain-containing protein [Maledivibacter halophilus]|uniref:Transcriptional pleiotropic regulator of transition state genes n=1 Tax=Maledivibacter halophilus TaxID=36842 RepID=A0A1T5KGC4_9FIRM|nr:AbrB/MazE/SpoVT family DNA-binding domain-containing protein [Maledivibacter halophilus]SKC62776.1 transcriptional pleiotropic regulator of transition state genes [Maledivibacter halophilus]
MKATGIVRKLDNLGRIVLPMELRRTMSIKTGTPIEIFADLDKIVFSKYKERCYICGNEDKLMEFKEKHICQNCINDIKNR